MSKLFLPDSCFKYGLHDTEINAIEFVNGKINLIFNTGVYKLNEEGKETEKTSKCIVALEISGFDKISPWKHITVYKVRKNKFKEISLNDFCEMLKDNEFKIYLDYYCIFAKSMLLKGSLGKFGIEITLTEIEKVTYNF